MILFITQYGMRSRKKLSDSQLMEFRLVSEVTANLQGWSNRHI
ncbi:hypothetical protein [Crocosphaera watsonii]|nr:hypothetical protein [Crocosphaera watsonii]